MVGGGVFTSLLDNGNVGSLVGLSSRDGGDWSVGGVHGVEFGSSEKEGLELL